MQKRVLALLATLTLAGIVAAASLATASPVGALPVGPVQTVKLTAGATFRVTLPKPGTAGRGWRVARAYDSAVVREAGEGTKPSGEVWVSYRAIAPGTTRVVFALTRGETPHAYASRTFLVVVSRAANAAGCPGGLLPLPANGIGPAVAAALAADEAKNRPQVTAAAIATADPQRGPQVKAQCGVQVQARTVIVYITDRAFLPSQSLSQRVLFVGRTSAGYHVWERAR